MEVQMGQRLLLVHAHTHKNHTVLYHFSFPIQVLYPTLCFEWNISLRNMGSSQVEDILLRVIISTCKTTYTPKAKLLVLPGNRKRIHVIRFQHLSYSPIFYIKDLPAKMLNEDMYFIVPQFRFWAFQILPLCILITLPRGKLLLISVSELFQQIYCNN